jgi:hypothetical protein
VALGSLAVTPGSGATVATFDRADAKKDQLIRPAPATACTVDPWTVAITARTLTGAEGRLRMLMFLTPTATGRVYFRWDATNPTTTVASWFLDPGERWEVWPEIVNLDVRMIGATAAGTLYTTIFTAA